MSDNHQRYRSIRSALSQMFLTEPKGYGAKQLNVLASLISGIVGSRSTNYPKIASKVPDRRKLESRVKSYSRYMDPRHAPGVGTPVTGGLTYREAHLICELVAETGKLVGMDVVEVNSILDIQNQTDLMEEVCIVSALQNRQSS
jgi:hypothetical protein